MSMVFQDPMQSLNPSLRLGRQMAEVLTTHQGLSTDTAWDKSVAMLKRVHMPDPHKVMARYPHQISGGQQQRVVIAMAMLNNPALLIMDEPTTALDVTVEAAVLDLVAELKEAYDTGIIYITHDLGVVARVADRMVVMYAGEIIEQGLVDNVFASPRHPYTRGLLRCIPRMGTCKETTALSPIRGRVPRPSERPENACIFSPRCDFSLADCTRRRPELDSATPDIKVRCFRAKELARELSCRPVTVEQELTAGNAVASDSLPLLRVKQLKTYYHQSSGSLFSWMGFGRVADVKAVDEVSFDVPRGSVFGLVGESGCGKTTLIKTVLGLEPATAGRLIFDDQDVTRPLRKRGLSQVQNLQIVFQNPDATLNPSYTIGRQIARPLKRFGLIPRAQIRQRVEELLRAVRLPAVYYERLPRQLSGGEKQRVGLARALASEPQMILCDEPVSALDVSIQAAVLKLLMEIQEQFNTTLVFISHNLSVVRYICDSIAIMYLGQIVEIGPAEAVTRPPLHPYTAALLSAVPVPDPMVKNYPIRLSGDVTSAISPPSGCRFHPRCPWRRSAQGSGEICREVEPLRRELGRGHTIMCHLNDEQLAGIIIDRGAGRESPVPLS
jgi:peptide/nickel transport system ATP-binding protein